MPEADPLSPVGDPPKGERVTNTTSEECRGTGENPCCGSCITFSVTVVNLADTEEEYPGNPGKFRFTAVASCGSGAPSSITVGYHRIGSTASAESSPPDYYGPITSDSVTIDLVYGSGNKVVEYNVNDDAFDEPTEHVKVTIPSTPVINPTGTATATSGMYDNDVEWHAGDAIEGTIYTEAGDDPAIPVNHTLGLSVDALDRDLFKDDGMLSVVYDDVTSGDTAEDYHVSWTASEGKFIQNGVEVTTAYGTSVTYLAPDWVAGPNERTVTITATVDDANRGDDTLGFNDPLINVRMPVKVNQVTLTKRQEGNVSENNDVVVGPQFGGGKLGWLTPKQPHW